jgi:alpha-beta hydrolase superfamily lysophospholipase
MKALARPWTALAAVVFALGATVALAQDNPPPSSLPRSLSEAIAMERADALPRTGFYDIAPAALARTRPGDLLRRADASDYALPQGAKAVRFLYHSKDADGRDVATSGVVLIPAGAAPTGGWPIVAWAHGTSGVARMCAPSLMRDLAYGEEGLMPMVRAGFAVVATDYHGLGTQGPHQYVSKTAQARDVVFAIPAARAAVPELGRGWVVDGHSQGGLAAWAVAELEATRHDPGYLGAVAIAPATNLGALADMTLAPKGVAFYLDYLTYAIHARSPGFSPARVLTGAALSRYADVTTKGCWNYAFASFLDDSKPSRLRSGWAETAAAKRFFADTVVGQVRLTAPLLVIAGEADQSVPIDGVRHSVAIACHTGSALEFKSYPGLDHDPVMVNSTPDQLDWIRARFSDQPVSSNCKVETK